MVMSVTSGGLLDAHLEVIVNGNIILKVKELTENPGKNSPKCNLKKIIICVKNIFCEITYLK